MDEALRKEYEEWVEKVQRELVDHKEWVEQYGNYAKNMMEHKDLFIKARKTFHVYKPLHAYLTIGNVKDKHVNFDLRYLGQSVGTIKVGARKRKPRLSVNETQANNSERFNYRLGIIENKSWSTSELAKAFRAFYKNEAVGSPRQEEHMVESALFSELEKTKSVNKTLCGIQPVSYANSRIHMKTSLKASDAKKNVIEQSKTGGETDILCRRNIKPGESRFVVIEVKDENKKNESFDDTMKQAISYAVFISELIHSNAGKDWMKIWGMENQIKGNYIIDCVVAMPKGDTEPSYAGEKIEIPGTGDKLELHYMKIKDYDSENVEFESSFDNK